MIIREGSEEGVRVLSNLAAQTLKYLMFSSVENGTGKNASVSGWQIAGKQVPVSLSETHGLLVSRIIMSLEYGWVMMTIDH